jgi:hypothetical protein
MVAMRPEIDRVPRLLYAAAALAVAGYLAAELWLLGNLGFPLDDSWIHLQFAKQLAAGHGLAYSGLERVTGSTAPLWTAMLALLGLLPGNAVAWTKLLGALLHLASVGLTYRLARQLDLRRGLAALAALWTLLAYWLVWSSVSGMEVPLFIVLSLAGMILQVSERADPSRPPVALPVFAVGALVRPEGYLLLALAAVDSLLGLPRRELLAAVRRVLQGAFVAALIVLPVWAVYARIGGSPLPTTFGAKAGAARGLPDLQYLYLVVGILFRPLPFATLLAAGGVLRLAERLGSRRDVGLLPGLWAMALPLAYSMLAPQGKHLLVGNFGRYFFPLLPVVAVLAAAACEGIGEAMNRSASWRWLRAAAIALLLAPTLATLVQGAARYAQNVANVEDSDVAMALWLRDRLPAPSVLAVQDIGALGFVLPNRLVDVSGIVSPRAQTLVREATSPEDPFGAGGMRRFLEETRPDYLVAYPAWYPALVAGGGFVPIHTVKIDANITMAGDELVLYSTPWTRYPLLEPAASKR